MVGFGRPYIANPNLVGRLAIGAPLAEVDWQTVYLAHVYCFDELSFLGSNQGRQRRLPNRRGLCDLFWSPAERK
jgi:hypothetical protein